MAAGSGDGRGSEAGGRDSTADEAIQAAASQPLLGVRVVVTRPEAQAEGLSAAFARQGALVERLPLLEVVPADDPGPLRQAVAALPRHRWAAFTSANAVHPVAEVLADLGEAWPGEVRVAAVGGATATALERHGLEVTLTTEGGGEALAEALGRSDPHLAGARVFLPQAVDARPELAEGLRARGAEVNAVVAYGKRLPAGARERASALFPPSSTLGWVTFTSPRIARAFADLVEDLATHGGGWEERRLSLLAASIGPTTSAALRELGVDPTVEAETPGDEGLVEAVRAVVADRNRFRL